MAALQRCVHGSGAEALAAPPYARTPLAAAQGQGVPISPAARHQQASQGQQGMGAQAAGVGAVTPSMQQPKQPGPATAAPPPGRQQQAPQQQVPPLQLTQQQRHHQQQLQDQQPADAGLAHSQGFEQLLDALQRQKQPPPAVGTRPEASQQPPGSQPGAKPSRRHTDGVVLAAASHAGGLVGPSPKRRTADSVGTWHAAAASPRQQSQAGGQQEAVAGYSQELQQLLASLRRITGDRSDEPAAVGAASPQLPGSGASQPRHDSSIGPDLQLSPGSSAPLQRQQLQQQPSACGWEPGSARSPSRGSRVAPGEGRVQAPAAGASPARSQLPGAPVTASRVAGGPSAATEVVVVASHHHQQQQPPPALPQPPPPQQQQQPPPPQQHRPEPQAELPAAASCTPGAGSPALPGQGHHSQQSQTDSNHAPAAQRQQQQQQEEGVQGGPLAGLTVIIDSRLAPAVAARAADAVARAGARAAGGSHAGAGARLAVCDAARAGHWLGLQLDVVSPAWLDRAAGGRGGNDGGGEEGAPGPWARCVRVSKDLCQGLVVGVGDDGTSQAGWQVPASSAQALDASLLTALQAAAQGGGSASAGRGAALSRRLSPLPPLLLADVCWSVLQPPAEATASSPVGSAGEDAGEGGGRGWVGGWAELWGKGEVGFVCRP